MRDSTPSAIYLKDYRPPDYLVDTVDLEFDLQEGLTTVSSPMQIHCMKVLLIQRPGFC